MLQTKKNLYATALVARLSMELASQTILYRKNPAPSSRANYSLLFFIFFLQLRCAAAAYPSLCRRKKKEPKSSRAEGSCRAVWWSCDEVCCFSVAQSLADSGGACCVSSFYFALFCCALSSYESRAQFSIFPFIHLFTFHRRDMPAAEKHLKTSLGSSHDAIAADNFVRASSSSSRPLPVPHLSPLRCASVASLSPASCEKKVSDSSLNLHHPRCAPRCTEREAFQRAILHNTSHTMCCVVILSFRYYFILFIFRYQGYLGVA